MNKKIFAALASATMALSATGSLAVFAEDFDVVEENNNGNANAGVSTGVVLNSTNFPDKDFRDAVGTIFKKEDGEKISKQEFEKVTDLTLDSTAGGNTGVATGGTLAATVVVNGPTGIKDLTGIQYFTKLESLTVTDFSDLETVDLSENANLATVDITGAASLETLNLPAGTDLTSVTVQGTLTDGAVTNRAPITTLDLSQNKTLSNVTINGTEIASLDLSNNTWLTAVDVADNYINTLNLTGTYGLVTLKAGSNHLYSIDLPTVAKDLVTLNLSGNLLQELTLPKLPKVTSFDVSNNQLKTIDVDQLTNAPASITTLNIENNHIGAIDLTKFDGSSVTVGNQIIYIGKEYDELNLADNFDDFDNDWVTGTVTGATYEDGILSGIGSAGVTYTYSTNNGDNTKTTFNMTVDVVPADILNRLYNPNSGEHFYTKDLEEKDVLVDLGWHDEGIGWTSPVDSTVPVFRLYNPNAGDHHYTKSSKERDVLVSVGWKYEGIGWYSFEGTSEVNPNTATPDPIPVYREYNPNAKAAGAHNYTTNEAENDFLVSVGWLEEGIAWNAMK